jgi:hypothetical protein
MYMQVIVRVVDDHGSEVPDFNLEFFMPKAKQDAEAVYFHANILEDVHPHGENEAYAACSWIEPTWRPTIMRRSR